MKNDKDWKRLFGIGDADRSEFQRLFKENKELRLELLDLRTRHGIVYEDFYEWLRWLENLNLEQLGKLSEDIKSLMKKYRIDDKWSGKFWREVWNVKKLRGKQIKSRPGYETGGGFPKVRVKADVKEGKNISVSELVITPEVDIENPLVIEFIKTWQRHYRDPPPKPQRIPGNSKGKIDWRPVVEWLLRHPDVTQDEAAHLLGYHPTYFRKKLSEFK